jgi:hypothetical protein
VILPLPYRLERLARRWNVPAWEVEEAMADPTRRRWVYRGLQFIRMEGSVKVTRGST